MRPRQCFSGKPREDYHCPQGRRIHYGNPRALNAGPCKNDDDCHGRKQGGDVKRNVYAPPKRYSLLLFNIDFIAHTRDDSAWRRSWQAALTRAVTAEERHRARYQHPLQPAQTRRSITAITHHDVDATDYLRNPFRRSIHAVNDALRQAGIDITAQVSYNPDWVGSYASVGSVVRDPDAVQSGDLVIYDFGRRDGYNHIGIYAGNGMAWNSPLRKAIVGP